MSDTRIDEFVMGGGPPRGSIVVAEAYARGKMLSHASWVLANGRMLSDIDAVLDNNGHVLFIELHRQSFPVGWEGLSTGQRWLYSSLCRASDQFAAVLARHNTWSNATPIDSRNDILDAVVRFRRLTAEARLTGDEYRLLVQSWGSDAQAALGWLDTIAAAQREAKP